MPDFNKGDFTQQGVAGHVNANLRLNEKRLVSIDLTSNEEAEGCTITGTVKDLLNDKVYNIGSGGGGGDTIPKCTITFVNNSGDDRNVNDYFSGGVNIENNLITSTNDSIVDGASETYDYLYQKDPNNQIYIGFPDNGVISNVVNCIELTEGDTAGAYAPIDPAVDSSFTITASGE